MPAARSESASPSTSGASGPMTTRPIALLAQNASHRAHDPPDRARPARHARRCPDCPARRRAASQQRRLRQLPRQRMFAPARPQQQDVHARPLPTTFDDDDAPGALVAQRAAPATTPRRCRSPRFRRLLKRTVEERFGFVRLRGELSGVKRAASGHLYCCLKDEGARIDGVMWRGSVAAARVPAARTGSRSSPPAS